MIRRRPKLPPMEEVFGRFRIPYGYHYNEEGVLDETEE